MAKSPHLSKIHDGRMQRVRQPVRPSVRSKDINRIFSPSTERMQFDFEERLSFIDSKPNDQMPLSSSTTTSSTTSSLSSLASLSSPSHSTPSHIKLKSTLIPTQYRVYIPQKKCEMKQAYTDYVYSTDQPTNTLTSASVTCHNECPKQNALNSKPYVNANPI